MTTAVRKRSAVDKVIDAYVENITDRLLDEGDPNDAKGLSYIVDNQFTMEWRRNREIATPREAAYATEAMRMKAVELAPAFLQDYRKCRAKQGRLTKAALTDYAAVAAGAASGIGAFGAAYLAVHSLAGSGIIAAAATFFGIEAAGCIQSLVDRKAQKHIDGFEKAVRDSFYSTLRN